MLARLPEPSRYCLAQPLLQWLPLLSESCFPCLPIACRPLAGPVRDCIAGKNELTISVYLFEHLALGSTHGAAIGWFLFRGVAADGTDIVSIGLFASAEIVKKLLVELCMNLFYLIGIMK